MGNMDPHHTQAKMLQVLKNCDKFFDQMLYKHFDDSSYNNFSVIDKKDEDRLKYSAILKKMVKNPKQFDIKELQLGQRTNRSIACMLGLAICDALGACTQFIPFVKDRRDLIQHDFKDVAAQIDCGLLQTRFGKIGVWTDDCSMALCMADSLLLNKFKFEPKHIRFMFHMWLYHGLDNGGRQHSIGLGGNIKISMHQFCKNRSDYTAQKDKFNNGNGSLMRLAPIPICYSSQNNTESALKFSSLQSKTTHNGDEASQCSKLLALIIIRLINRKEDKNWREVIDQACLDYVKKDTKGNKTVQCLARSQQQSQQLFKAQQTQHKEKFTKFNHNVQDRNWNWKNAQFTYSPTRFKQQPGYIGSYCMDALAMALHTVWHSKSFQEVALTNANMGGDCDTVGAIAGQIAGAIYGIDHYMLHLYSQMDDCLEERFEVFLKALKLATQRPI